MFAGLRKWWRSLSGQGEEPPRPPGDARLSAPEKHMIDLDMEPDDPFMAHLLEAQGVVEIGGLNLKSAALEKLRAEGVKVVVPLISQGELIGTLNLGSRRSEQEYSSDDHRLLASLATQAAPALRVAQLARQQQAEARERERIEQELRVARVIQETLLPKELPVLAGWKLQTHWRPAREVSGDFYDFISFPDGKLGLVIADVTDKGVPAAMVMATTRSILRTAAEQHQAPGEVLSRANSLLCPSMPLNMFVTVTYALLDPANGSLRYANAGHPAMLLRTAGEVVELRARGMPLGLFEEMEYEEKHAALAPGDFLLMYSDGLIEAHGPDGSMFGTERLKQKLGEPVQNERLVQSLLDDLSGFTGDGWEQEDDVTLVTLEHEDDGQDQAGEILGEFSLPSRPGNEREAMRLVEGMIAGLGFGLERVEKIKTAVAEATMNAMEHGNQYREGLPAHIRVRARPHELVIEIVDFGGGKEIPEAEHPDLEAKLAGLQSPRGWGLFLIRSMVDDLRTYSDSVHHTIELVFKR